VKLTELSRYRLLRHRYLIITLILFLMVSLIITITLSGLFSIFNSFRYYVAPGENDIIIIDVGSRAPFTSSIDISIIENISQIKGVSRITFEVIVPVYVNDIGAIMRGISSRDITGFIDMELTQGNYLTQLDYDGVLIGHKLADRLGVSYGDYIIVRGVLRNTYHSVRVIGIFISSVPYDYEIIAPIDMAREFRGFSQSQASLIRIETAPEADASMIRNKVNSILLSMSNITRSLSLQRMGAVSVEDFTSLYMGKLGFNPYTLLVIPMVILFISIFIIKYLVLGLIDDNASILYTLYSLGLSWNDIIRLIILILLPYIALSTALGYIIGYLAILYIWSMNDIRFIIHVMPPSINYYIPIVLFLILTLATTYFIFKARRIT